jgi:hypothetical protein
VTVIIALEINISQLCFENKRRKTCLPMQRNGKHWQKKIEGQLLTVLLVLNFKRLWSKTFAHAQNVLCTEIAASMRQPSILRSSGSDTTRSGGDNYLHFYFKFR